MGVQILATAILDLDRLLHHSHIVNIRGNSYHLVKR
ncbi:ATP-binding protein [Brevibacillus massiliensis]|nr:ATP-binding protein [Brevibacillus massiliensis]